MFAGGEDGERNGVGFVEIFSIFETQDDIFFGSTPLDRVYPVYIKETGLYLVLGAPISHK